MVYAEDRTALEFGTVHPSLLLRLVYLFAFAFGGKNNIPVQKEGALKEKKCHNLFEHGCKDSWTAPRLSSLGLQRGIRLQLPCLVLRCTVNLVVAF